MTQMTTCDLHNETIIRLQRDLAAANARCEEYRKDAERYRTIRGAEFEVFRLCQSHRLTGSNLDAAIDAAIAAGKEK